MRKRKADERRNTLIALTLLSLVLLALIAVVVRPGVILPMSDASYGSSLGGTLNGGGGECSERSHSDWMVCVVETDVGSGGGATMLLKKRARGCWTASWRKGGNETLTGCVGIVDLLHPREPGAAY